jgi:hypothetical protein
MLAVKAHIRHTETNYDNLLSRNVSRRLAREQMAPKIDMILRRWENG